MTNLTPNPGWDDVPQLETNTKALGGPGAPMNLQAQALLNRTEVIDADGWVTDQRVLMPETADDGIDSAKMKLRADIGFPWISLATSLRGDYRASRFGLLPNTASPKTALMQEIIDWIQSNGGGTLVLDAGTYPQEQSPLTESFTNFDVAVPANTGCIIARPNVGIVGPGSGRCLIVAADATLTLIYQIAQIDVEFSGFSLMNSWEVGMNGAGHGMFTLGASNGSFFQCKRVKWRDIYVKGVASYGLSIQNGQPIGCVMENIFVENNGADGLDLKARDPLNTDPEPYGNSTNNIVVRNHGLRVTGSAGIDTRGIWNHQNVQVVDFGNNPALDYCGVRFRTMDNSSGVYTGIANRSTLNGFYVRASSTSTAPNLDGVVSGSNDCHISNGTVVGMHRGVNIVGNAAGSPARNTVTAVTAIDSKLYGFLINAQCQYHTLTACKSVNAATAGFRNAGDYTELASCDSINETTPISTSSGALPTQVINGGSLGPNSAITVSGSSNRTTVTPVGTNADLMLQGSGTGTVRLGVSRTAGGDVASNGFVAMKIADGSTVKLMTTE